MLIYQGLVTEMGFFSTKKFCFSGHQLEVDAHISKQNGGMYFLSGKIDLFSALFVNGNQSAFLLSLVFLRSLCKIEIQEVNAVWQCQENNDSVLLPSANYRHKYFGLKMTQKEQSWCQFTNELKRCEASKLKCGCHS